MAETIDELLVKLGCQVDAKSFKEANSQFAGIRTGALALGTAIIGAGVGMVKMSDGVARSVDTLGKWSDAAGVSIRRAQQLTFALQQAGSANAESDMMGMFANVESLRTQAQRGELSGWAMIESGLNLNSLMSMSNEEGLEFLMRGISDMADPERQRRAVDELGFSGVAQHGVMTNYAATQQAYRRSDELGQADADLIEKAAAYMDALNELKTSTDSLKNEIADHLLPRMTDWINALTGGVQEYKPAAANAAAILAGDGTSLEKMEAMSDDPEVSKALGDFWSWFKEWNKAIKYTLSAADAFEEYSKEKTGETLGERVDAVRKLREQQEAVRQSRPASPAAARSGLSADELGYEPASSELIPQGSRADLIEGNRRLLPNYVPALSRPTASNATTMNINVDARGSTDPLMTSERVRGVIRDEVGKMVDVSRDGIPTNVA